MSFLGRPHALSIRRRWQPGMGRSMLLEAWNVPVTSGVWCALVIVFGVITHSGWGYEDVGMSYEAVVSKRQVWRCLVASVAHVSPVHLLMNLQGLWSLSALERVLGVPYYLFCSALLLAGSTAVNMGITDVLVRSKVRGSETMRMQNSVGYSAVLFGMMTLMSQLEAELQLRGFRVLGFFVPVSFAPAGSLLLTQLLVPRASLLGHASGIVCGFALSLLPHRVRTVTTLQAVATVVLVLVLPVASTLTEGELAWVKERLSALCRGPAAALARLRGSGRDDRSAATSMEDAFPGRGHKLGGGKSSAEPLLPITAP